MLEADRSELTNKLGLPGPARWTQVVARRGKSVWRVDCPDGSYAVRIFRPGDEESASHEHQMMIEAHKLPIPVPAARTAATLGTRPVLLVDWSPGESLGQTLHSRPWAALRLGRLFGEQQAKLHLNGARDAQILDWIEFFGPVDQVLRDSLRQAQVRCSLVHLDYHPRNLVFGDGAISGILDWTNSRFGDPRADLARTWTILRLVQRSGRRHPVRRVAEKLFEHGWWQGYVRIAGPQPQMPLFLAWAVFGLLRMKTREATSPEDRRELTALARLTGELRAKAGLAPVETEALLDQASTGF
jgi:aminoglycoside phosphotransferase (APT) family kinase protein